MGHRALTHAEAVSQVQYTNPGFIYKNKIKLQAFFTQTELLPVEH